MRVSSVPASTFRAGGKGQEEPCLWPTSGLTSTEFELNLIAGTGQTRSQRRLLRAPHQDDRGPTLRVFDLRWPCVEAFSQPSGLISRDEVEYSKPVSKLRDP